MTHRPRQRLGMYMLAGALIVGAYVLWGSSEGTTWTSIPVGKQEYSTTTSTLAVVMPFTSFDVQKVRDNLAGWQATPPCSRPPPAPRPVFYLYSNKQLEQTSIDELQGYWNALPKSVQRCFQDFRFTHAEIAAELDHYNPDARDSGWVAGPNEQFYQLMNGSRTAEGTTHVFMMEPDTRPVVDGWLEQLVKVVDESEPFWIRGSAFRPACARRKTAFTSAAEDCHQLGPEIADHINGNALYNIGDPTFGEFLDKVRNSAFAKWPFDLAWLRYIRAPEKEQLRRSILTKIVYTDMVQNLGAASFDLAEICREHPWTYFVHSDRDGRNETMSSVDPHSSIEVDSAALLDNPLRATLLPALKLVAAPKTNNVMLAFGTGNYLPVMRNFVHYVRTAGITNFILIAMDKESVAYAEEAGVPYHAYLDEEVVALGGSDSYTSAGFRRVVNRRSAVISTALRGGFHILQSDLDVIWVKNPFPFFFKGDYEYEIQSDGRTGFGELDPAAPFKEFVNSGVFYARGTPRMADFYDILIHTVHENPERREQHLLNTILEANVLRIKYRILDPILFPNGFQYFTRAVSTRAGIEPFCIHNNWVDGKRTKEYRFRELGMWTQDPPEYFDKEKTKYLVYYEPSMADNSWSQVRASLRSALAIAQVLGRTLILPKFYSHHGQPVFVTLDYFLDYDEFSATFPDFRESSFTERIFPTPPKHIFHIDIGSSSSVGPLPATIPQITFKAAGAYRGATDVELTTWFAPYQHEEIIHLSSAYRRFHKFVDAAEDQAFEERLSKGLTPAPTIRNTASFIVKKVTEAATAKSGSPKYNCAHLRRGSDFISAHSTEEKLLSENIKLLAATMPADQVVYVTSDQSGEAGFRQMVRQQLPEAHFWSEYDRPWFEHLVDPELGESMRLGAIEQQVCKWGQKFVGNIKSDFSIHICYLRVGLGKTGDDACRDIYSRLYPTDMDYY